jgi:hypothetical protein
MDKEDLVPSSTVTYLNDHPQQLKNKHLYSMDKEDPAPSSTAIHLNDHP